MARDGGQRCALLSSLTSCKCLVPPHVPCKHLENKTRCGIWARDLHEPLPTPSPVRPPTRSAPCAVKCYPDPKHAVRASRPYQSMQTQHHQPPSARSVSNLTSPPGRLRSASDTGAECDVRRGNETATHLCGDVRETKKTTCKPFREAGLLKLARGAHGPSFTRCKTNATIMTNPMLSKCIETPSKISKASWGKGRSGFRKMCRGCKLNSTFSIGIRGRPLHCITTLDPWVMTPHRPP